VRSLVYSLIHLKGLAHGERKNNGPKTFQQTHYTRSTDGDITPSAGLTGPYSLQDPFPNGLIPPADATARLADQQRNQAGQDAGAGEVSVECIEKARLPDFGFSRHGEIGAWLSQKTGPKAKNRTSKIKFASAQFGRWIARKAVESALE
jgi:hypothetical protein